MPENPEGVITPEQAAILNYARGLAEQEGPDSQMQKDYDEMISLLINAIMRQYLETGVIVLIKEEQDNG